MEECDWETVAEEESQVVGGTKDPMGLDVIDTLEQRLALRVLVIEEVEQSVALFLAVVEELGEMDDDLEELTVDDSQ